MFADTGPDVDLGDYPLGWTDPDKYKDDWKDWEPEKKPQPLYVFYTEEELCTSAVFQKHLNMALAAQERYIDKLRQEIMNLAFGENK